jgi:CRISPR-associated protein Csx1
MGKRVLIATWGNPSFWNEVEYNFCGQSHKSKTSLFPLINVLKPDLVIIFGLDTIADINTTKELTYKGLKESAEDKIRKFCQENGIFKSLPDESKIIIVIPPGGGYYPSATFLGKLQDFYHVVLHELITIFIDIIFKQIEIQHSTECPDKNKKDFLEIHLDLTHGINFMPALTYRAIKELVQIIDIFINVHFFVYNSEPFVFNSSNRSPLTIHPVEEETKIRPHFPHEYIEDNGSNKISLLKPITDNYGKKKALIGSNITPLDINTFFCALFYGLPLAIYTFFIEPNKLKVIIDDATNLFFQKIEVDKENTVVIVKRELSFTEEFAIINKAYLLAELLTKLGIKQKDVITFDAFTAMADSVFKKFLNIRATIFNEKHYFSKYIFDKSEPEWKSVIDICQSDLNGKKSEPNPRNFIAHAGLEKTLTMIRKEDGNFFLKYDKTKIDIIKKIANKAIKLKD